MRGRGDRLEALLGERELDRHLRRVRPIYRRRRDAMLEAARVEADPDVRRGIAEDINRRFADQCAVLEILRRSPRPLPGPRAARARAHRRHRAQARRRA